MLEQCKDAVYGGQHKYLHPTNLESSFHKEFNLLDTQARTLSEAIRDDTVRDFITQRWSNYFHSSEYTQTIVARVKNWENNSKNQDPAIKVRHIPLPDNQSAAKSVNIKT